MRTCQKPDRDCPALFCGHPLPCPWHTALIDPPMVVTIPVGASVDTCDKLQQIAEALHDPKAE